MRISDWSSDVCSSDLFEIVGVEVHDDKVVAHCGNELFQIVMMAVDQVKFDHAGDETLAVHDDGIEDLIFRALDIDLQQDILVHPGHLHGLLQPQHTGYMADPNLEMTPVGAVKETSVGERNGQLAADRKSTRLNSSHSCASRMPSSA